MKKLVLTICLCLICLLNTAHCAKAVSLYDAMNGDKPFILLIYADWAKYQKAYENMKFLQPKFKNYDFIKVNLADAEAKILFTNPRFIVNTMPMIVLAKNGGKIKR